MDLYSSSTPMFLEDSPETCFGKKRKSKNIMSLEEYKQNIMAQFGKKRRSRFGGYDDYDGDWFGAAKRRVGRPRKTTGRGRSPVRRRKSPVRRRKSPVRRRIKPRSGNACSQLRKMACQSSPSCRYVKGSGCRRRRVTKTDADFVMAGGDDDVDLGAYMDAAEVNISGVEAPVPDLFYDSAEDLSFGKRRRKVRKNAKKTHADFRRLPRKLSAKIRKMCKKLKIKTTKKSGKKRVYRKESVLKKLIAKKLKKNKTKVVRRRRD